MKRRPEFLAIASLIVAIGATAGVPLNASQERKQDAKPAVTISGKWTMSVKAPAPHGAMTAALVLKQEGKKVTGTFAGPHGGDVLVTGEFAEGILTLAAEGDGSHTFHGKLRDDGTLAGYLSTPIGDMTFTAERVKG